MGPQTASVGLSTLAAAEMTGRGWPGSPWIDTPLRSSSPSLALYSPGWRMTSDVAVAPLSAVTSVHGLVTRQVVTAGSASGEAQRSSAAAGDATTSEAATAV